jgi:prepilin-type processing-associated H-X9-DG protein
VLIKDYNIAPKQFCCPSSDTKKGQSSYAINVNIAGKKISEVRFPYDTVLLFETKSGVNPAGGPEILNADNHRGNGCNVLFAGGQVKFIKYEEFDKLRWNPE